jgi:hypothetical protein
MSWRSFLIETRLLARAVESVMAPPPVKRGSPAARFMTALAAILGFAACVALAAGVFMWLDEVYPLRQALVLFGAGGILVASVIGGATYAVSHWRKIKLRIAKKVVERKVHSLFDAVMDEFEVPVKLYPKTATAIAALAGVAIGDRLGDRRERALQEVADSIDKMSRNVRHRIPERLPRRDLH